MGAGALQTNLRAGGEDLEPERYALPSAEEAAEEGTLDLTATLRRIKEVARVLDRFKELRDPGRSRSDYLEQVGPCSSLHNACQKKSLPATLDYGERASPCVTRLRSSKQVGVAPRPNVPRACKRRRVARHCLI